MDDKTRDRFAEIERLAYAAGLEPYDLCYFNVPASVIYEVASYGLPTRYSHWSFGRVYEQQRTQGEMGMSKIYELVLNNDPSYAFLDKNNPETINLLICAHVLGHSDFFKNNVMFKQANETSMIQVAKRHAEIIDNYRKDYGEDEVDHWLDIALALERHIDVYKGRKREKYPPRNIEYKERTPTEWEDIVDRVRKPLVEKQLKGVYLPPRPERDILWFLTEYSNLENWQKRIFEIVRRESYYFYPQYKTKIINEGWACLTGDSYVQTSQGYRKFKSIVDDAVLLPSCLEVVTGIIGDNEAMQIQSISDYHETEPQVTAKIMTSKGIFLEGAYNHKVIASKNVCGESITGDVNLIDIGVGDFVKMPIGQDIWPLETVKCNFEHPRYSRSKDFCLPSEINEDVARFLGFFLSEGCTVKRGVQITNKDKVLIEAFCSVCERVFNLRPEIVPWKDDPDKYDCIIWCSDIVRFLENLDIDLIYKSKNKEVPSVIMESPKRVVAAFLAAYYAGDDGCYNENRIVLSTSSPRMAEQTGLLLLNFGIDYGFSENNKSGYAPNYHLTITSKPNVWAFAKYIGFYGSPKKELCCKRILEFNGNKYKTNVRYIYSKVIQVSQGFDILYDITVPGTHHYLAQACINHNSYWHAELMLQYSLGNDNDYNITDLEYPLTSEEHLDFAAAHEKVVQPGPRIRLKIDTKDQTGKIVKKWNPQITQNPRLFNVATRINPYYVGFKMFRDIKKRWDEYYKDGYMEDDLGQKIPVTINGDTKIREVMMEEDDVSFLRNYLTEELVEELHLFNYGNIDGFDDNYGIQEEPQTKKDEYDEDTLTEQSMTNKTIEVTSKEVKDLLRSFSADKSNYGVPEIVVRRVDESGLLRLEHLDEDPTNVDLKYAKEVLKYIGLAWTRPVELIRREKDKTRIIRYDGISDTVEVDYETSDYPEVLESEAPPSSW